MRNLIKVLLILLSMSSTSLLAGPGVGGGGVIIANAHLKKVTININDISDIQLKDFSIIPTGQLFAIPSLNKSFELKPSGKVTLDFSKLSPISDVQLITGEIISFHPLD
jgi:hypothetical protein